MQLVDGLAEPVTDQYLDGIGFVLYPSTQQGDGVCADLVEQLVDGPAAEYGGPRPEPCPLRGRQPLVSEGLPGPFLDRLGRGLDLKPLLIGISLGGSRYSAALCSRIQRTWSCRMARRNVTQGTITAIVAARSAAISAAQAPASMATNRTALGAWRTAVPAPRASRGLLAGRRLAGELPEAGLLRMAGVLLHPLRRGLWHPLVLL